MQRNIWSANGFTLIELMIVVAIIGILSAVAIPAYFNHLLRIRQSDGTQQLLDIKLAQEKYYTLNDTYATTTADATFKSLLSFDPADPNNFYTFTITAPTPKTGFTAIAKGDLNGDTVAHDCWQITESLAAPQVYSDAVCTGVNDEGFSFSLISQIL